MVLVVFYQQPLEHRVQTKITELFLPVEAVGIHGPWNAAYCGHFGVVLGSGDNCLRF